MCLYSLEYSCSSREARERASGLLFTEQTFAHGSANAFFEEREREREVFRGGVCFDSDDVCMYVRTYAGYGYEVFFLQVKCVCEE